MRISSESVNRFELVRTEERRWLQIKEKAKKQKEEKELRDFEKSATWLGRKTEEKQIYWYGMIGFAWLALCLELYEISAERWRDYHLPHNKHGTTACSAVSTLFPSTSHFQIE